MWYNHARPASRCSARSLCLPSAACLSWQLPGCQLFATYLVVARAVVYARNFTVSFKASVVPSSDCLRKINDEVFSTFFIPKCDRLLVGK